MSQALVRAGSRQARQCGSPRRTWISVGLFLWRRGVWFAYDLILNHSCLLKPAAPFILEFPTNTQAVPDRQGGRLACGHNPSGDPSLETSDTGFQDRQPQLDKRRGLDKTRCLKVRPKNWVEFLALSDGGGGVVQFLCS